MSPAQRPPRHLSPALGGLLVLALLLAQWLGLAHRSLHLWETGRTSAEVSVPAASPAGQADAPGIASLLRALLGEHADSASCRLYDHAASGEAGFSAALALPADCPAGLPGWVLRPAPAVAPATAFHARAPPALG